MSLFFYACDKSEIKALVGVKAMILPLDIAQKIKKKLDSIGQNQQTLEMEFKNCLEREISSEELKEEYNHFKCLNHSKVAKCFYARNVLVRHSYNYYIRKKVTTLLHPHPILKDVLTYWIDYSYFHYVAFPIIEGAYIYHKSNTQDKKEEQILYGKRIKKFLMENPNDFTDKEISYKNIGHRVDRNFYLLLRSGRNILERLEFKEINDEKNSKYCYSSFLIYYMFKNLLKRSAFWVNVGRALFLKIKFIYPHLLARLFNGNAKNQIAGQLPTILTGDFSISPTGFYYGKYDLKSHEKHYPSALHGGLANLLWHILSRCAVITCLIAMDVPEDDIFIYFKKLRKFNSIWRKKAKEAEFAMSLLDTEIINRVLEQFKKNSGYSPWKMIPILENIAINIFQKAREEDVLNLSTVDSPFHRAVNCSYMLI